MYWTDIKEYTIKGFIYSYHPTDQPQIGKKEFEMTRLDCADTDLASIERFAVNQYYNTNEKRERLKEKLADDKYLMVNVYDNCTEIGKNPLVYHKLHEHKDYEELVEMLS